MLGTPAFDFDSHVDESSPGYKGLTSDILYGMVYHVLDSNLYHGVSNMLQDDEQTILDFLQQEALVGHFDSTTSEIAYGVKLSYNRVVRLLERLIMRGQVAYRERGTERKFVRYFYLIDILDLCQERWR